VDCCVLIFGVNTIIRGLLGRADEGIAVLREVGNNLPADTPQHLRRLEDASKPI